MYMILPKLLPSSYALLVCLLLTSGILAAEESFKGGNSAFPKDSSPIGLSPEPEKPTKKYIPYDDPAVQKAVKYELPGMPVSSPDMSVTQTSLVGSHAKPPTQAKAARYQPTELLALPPRERIVIQAQYDLEDAEHALKVAQHNLQVARNPSTYTISPAKEITRRFGGGLDEDYQPREDVVKTFKIPAKVDTVAQQTGIRKAELELAGAKGRYETKLRNFNLAKQQSAPTIDKAATPVPVQPPTKSAAPLVPKPKSWWEILIDFFK